MKNQIAKFFHQFPISLRFESSYNSFQHEDGNHFTFKKGISFDHFHVAKWFKQIIIFIENFEIAKLSFHRLFSSTMNRVYIIHVNMKMSITLQSKKSMFLLFTFINIFVFFDFFFFFCFFTHIMIIKSSKKICYYENIEFQINFKRQTK